MFGSLVKSHLDGVPSHHSARRRESYRPRENASELRTHRKRVLGLPLCRNWYYWVAAHSRKVAVDGVLNVLLPVLFQRSAREGEWVLVVADEKQPPLLWFVVTLREKRGASGLG